MIDIPLAVLKVAWPFALAGAIWLWQETRIVAAHVATTVAEKRATDAEGRIAAAQKRASDLALLYANTLPKIDQAARDQEKKDAASIDALNARVATLSRAPTLHFSGLAIGLLDSINAYANNGNAAAPAVVTARADAVPETAAPASAGGYYSEAELVQYSEDAAAAYRDAVRMFHEARNAYNAAREAQLQVDVAKGATP